MGDGMRAWTWVAAVGAAVSVHAAATAAQPTFGKPKARPAEKQDTPGERTPAAEDDVLGSTGNPSAPGWSEWRDTDPERGAPSADAEPGKPYAWKTREGIRYTWTLPTDFKKGEGYDLVVLCHPDRADFRWGIMNHPAPATAGERGFRPRDIVVGIDGTTAQERIPDSRSFDVEPGSVVQFRDLVLEVSRAFPVNRIYLYGSGGGGRFAQCFASSFPALADGVVAHGCGAISDCVKKGDMPLVLMHGAKDLITPLHVSFDAAREYADAEHENVRVRVLQAFNDFPNPVRASECIDWLKAMRSDDAAEVLAGARAMLTPKKPDEYEYRTAVWFGAAREALGRVVGEGERAIKDAPEEARAEAGALIEKIEAEGARHAAILKGKINPAGLAAQSLDGGAWLGHLVAMREDFRGVKSVEEFAKAIGYDRLAREHEETAIGFTETWSPDGDAASQFEDGADVIQKCWLSQSLPLDFGARMRFWSRKAEEMKIPADALEKYEYVANWEKGWKDGLEAYEAEWRKWPGP